jgi:hypothetical protein
LTVIFTPSAVEKVKPDVDVASTMPVAPPGSGPERGPVGGVVVAEGVAVTEVVDPDDAATAVPVPAIPATAHVKPVAMIHPAFFFENNRPARGPRVCAAMLAGAEPADE